VLHVRAVHDQPRLVPFAHGPELLVSVRRDQA
jgi:hypothetical protein